jgi:hypothetical protein
MPYKKNRLSRQCTCPKWLYIVGDGIPISDAAGFQQARLAAIKPGDMLPQDESSVIAMKDGKPELAVATSACP